ncbi:SMP-30/gluconolactonase/LRE family protein [Hoeflea poritis]|uniref:SMP-30/gluconolactonase/LRE family protein n=1 Tax=Hoeflea poritis TaxID=2993659 RepID=A0ABT4VHX4_9HYPH|nr:SMP-30/gluconolactonase/LRE family protein [Hoeflea poritis]MDA4844301.1 SMP-30/gluconolactonase/LRE family protein [Hoeflea poritis]
MKSILSLVALIAVATVAYLTLWPVPIEPVAWSAPKDSGFAGAFSRNNRLADLKFVDLAGHAGPEDAALGLDGRIYTATHDGSIVRIDLESGSSERVASTGGRPMGIEFGPDDRLFIADALRGLMVMEKDGKIIHLSDRTTDGTPITYANDLDVSRTGVVYFTDSSHRFTANEEGDAFEAPLLDTLEQGRTGRILRYDPARGETVVIARGLSFANGIALSDDDSYLLVTETGTYTVWRLWLTGPKVATFEQVVVNLPGYPDNLNRAGDNTFWLGLASPRSGSIDALSDQPFLRKLVQRLPGTMRPQLERYGMVVRIDGNGNVLETLQDPDGEYALNTGALSGPNGELVVTSMTEPRLGYLEPGWDKSNEDASETAARGG